MTAGRSKTWWTIAVVLIAIIGFGVAPALLAAPLAPVTVGASPGTSPAPPAVATDGAVSLACSLSTGAGSCTGTLATTGTSDVIIVFLTLTALTALTPPVVSSPSYNSLSFTERAAAAVDSTGDAYFWEYYATTTSAQASATLTVSVTSGAAAGDGVAFGVSGANTVNPFNPSAAPTATKTSTSATITGNTVTTTISNDFILGFAASAAASGGYVAGTSFTEIDSSSGNSYSFAEYYTASTSTPGPFTARATQTNAVDNAGLTDSVAPDPTLTLTPLSGPLGTTVTATGTGFAPGDTATVTLSSTTLCTATVASGGGFSCSFAASSTKGFVHGSNTVSASDTAGNTAGATFTVTTPTLTLTPSSGPVGTTITLSGSGYAPGTVYDYCFAVATGDVGCATGSPSTFTATSSGDIPTSKTIVWTTDVSAPWVVVWDPSTVTNVANSEFTGTTPAITLTPGQGPSGVTVTVTGSGFTPTTDTGGSVTITFTISSGATVTPSGTCTVTPSGSSAGDFSCTVTITSSTSAAYTVSATGSDGSFDSATATFTVTTPSVTFTESGLATGTTWSVTLNGLTQSSSGSTITFSGLSSGSLFSYTVGAVNGYTVSPGPGSGTVPASVPITFTAASGTFAATFTQSGLASGTLWSVTLAGVGTRSTTGTTISFPDLSSTVTYDYTIGAVSGYTTSTSTGTVSSGSTSVTVTFSETTGAITVTFTESGLASGTVWSVTVVGVGTRSTTGTSISFAGLIVGDSYTYTVGSVNGYNTPSPSTGEWTASDYTTFPITFTAAAGTFAETFTESGLASGTVWGVTIGGLTKYTSASSITFVGLTSGATYTVDPPRGYTATPPSGTLTTGGTVSVSFSTASVGEPAAAGISSTGSGGSSGLLVLVGWTAMVGALAGGLLLALRCPASSRRER